MKKTLFFCFLIIPIQYIFPCIRQLNKPLRYPPIKSKSDFQWELRKEIEQYWNDNNFIPMLLKKGIIRRVEKIEGCDKDADSFTYALKKITGFPDGIVNEPIYLYGLYQRSKLSINIEKYFKQVKTPRSNDLVVYINNNFEINCLGVYQGPYTIISKYHNHPYAMTHILFNIPPYADKNKDAAVFFRLKRKYKDKNLLITTMREDNLKNMLNIFYHEYFRTGKYEKKDFILMYSRVVCDPSVIDKTKIEDLMQQYVWEKPYWAANNPVKEPDINLNYR